MINQEVKYGFLIEHKLTIIGIPTKGEYFMQKKKFKIVEKNKLKFILSTSSSKTRELRRIPDRYKLFYNPLENYVFLSKTGTFGMISNRQTIRKK